MRVQECRPEKNKTDMVSIHVDGQDRTAQISDWKINANDRHGTLQLTCRFPSGKTYSRPLNDCRVVPTRELVGVLLTRRGSAVITPVERATVYGERYAVVRHSGSEKTYVYHMEGISFVAQTVTKEAPVFRYFLSVATARRDGAASTDQERIAANVMRQLDELLPSPDTALHVALL